MKFRPLNLTGAFLIETRAFHDDRGAFAETYRQDVLAEAGVVEPFVQENTSRSHRRGTVRGLHFQAPPAAQAKLLRVVSGAIYDVIVDLRTGSATYGQWDAVELSAKEATSLYVPPGFAHGFCTTADETAVTYKLSAYYAPEAEGGLLWSDPDLGIPWPVRADEAILNERDRAWPRLRDFRPPF